MLVSQVKKGENVVAQFIGQFCLINQATTEILGETPGNKKIKRGKNEPGQIMG